MDETNTPATTATTATTPATTAMIDSSVTNAADTAFLMFCGVLVFSMQLGFTLLEIGCVSMKNTSNILFQNLMDAAVAGVSFYLVGYAFAYGTGTPFIGGTNFAILGLDTSYEYAFWFIQFAFAATTSSIVAGAIAERAKITAYCGFAPTITALVYPVVVHWVWSSDGWASTTLSEEKLLFGVGAIDFAGSTVVHSVGGLTALIGCVLLGPRRGRFDEEGRVNEMPMQSTVLQTAGTFLLWIGWYGFNVGSTLSIQGRFAIICGKVVVNMTISAAAAGLGCTALSRLVNGAVEVAIVNNGILAGLVSITASCGVVTAHGALVIGLVGGAFYFLACKLLLRLKIDDVVEAVPVHLVSGVWGTLAVGLFAHPHNVNMMYGTGSCGVFYTAYCGEKAWLQLAAQLILILANLAWTGVMATLVFGGLKLAGWLRVDSEAERLGLDVTYHGVYAYEIMPPAPDLPTPDNGCFNGVDECEGKV